MARLTAMASRCRSGDAIWRNTLTTRWKAGARWNSTHVISRQPRSPFNGFTGRSPMRPRHVQQLPRLKCALYRAVQTQQAPTKRSPGSGLAQQLILLMGNPVKMSDDSSDSGYTSGSDSRSKTGQPVESKVEGDAAYPQLLNDALIVDAVTRRAVTSKTRLAALYKYTEPGIDNGLVEALATTVKPYMTCQLETADGKCYPPSIQVSRTQYYLKLTFANMYLAPVVRLECHFIKPWEKHPPYLSLTVDFHFNDYTDEGDEKIDNFSWINARMKFNAGQATCSGFNNIGKVSSLLGPVEMEVIEILRAFIRPKERNDATLHTKLAALHPEAQRCFADIGARLPGGRGTLFPSIGGREYAAFGGHQNKIVISDHGAGLIETAALMSAPAPLPMVPLESKTTFASIREAAVELAYSAKIADEESREALRLWQAVEHHAELQLHHEFPVLAVWFDDFDRLGTKVAQDDIQFRLPREVACDFLPVNMRNEPNRHLHKLAGFLLSTTGGMLNQRGPSPSAMFRITSHTVEKLLERYDNPGSRSFKVKCAPHVSSFTYYAQLDTVKQLQMEKNKRWWPILLNQSHEELKLEDPTAGVPAPLKARAEKWLRGWKNWNPEQLEIIDNITKAKGGMTLVMGPAATGKTLLQRGIAIYFYSLGYHVLALAPANDNANKIAKDMLDVKEEIDWIDVNFNRLFPGSRDIPIERMTDKQAAVRDQGHEGGEALPLRELLHKLQEPGSNGDHREYGVIESVIRTADEKSLTLFKASREADISIAKDVDSWDILRELIAECRGGTFDTNEKKKLEKYRLAYRACKGQVIALNRFMITTTGNVRSRELLEFWFSLQKDYGVPRKGVVVLIDESAKDVEANVWAGIVCERWAASVKGVYLFGDDKQLQPTNTSSKGRVQFNYFSDRLDIALPNRLEEEGFPCYRLLEQRRMQQAISAFPNRIIYDGKLRNGPGMDVSLDEQMPGLRQTLVEILAGGVKFSGDAAKIREEITDDDLRRHYFEVHGRREIYEKSIVVHEHVDAFVNKILPGLFDFFRASGRSMRKEVMIICAYNYARSEYDRKIREFLRTRPGSTTDDMPRIMSVDSSQGDEAFMVFFDASAQYGDRIGFMENKNRFNVAITRAKAVFWMIGGSMSVPIRYKGDGRRDRPNLMTQYKRELDAADQVHRF